MSPDYAGDGILNLITSLAAACGRPDTSVPPLTVLPVEQLAATRHIVFLVIDGLGQKTLERNPGCANLRRHHIATLRSVFPSTTASAIPAFMTGLAPAQHGLTGWHMYLEEIDEILAILPMTRRGSGSTSGQSPAPLPADLPGRIFLPPTFFTQFTRECWVLAPQRIVGTPFNAWHAAGASTLGYATLAQMFEQLATLLQDGRQARYIYAYFPELDSLSHHFGADSDQARAMLAEIDAGFGDLVRAVSGCDAWLIATADHGFIDSPPGRSITLNDHPQLGVLLARPLCGERRVAYAYVGQANRPAFEAYLRTHLAAAVDLRPSAELISAGCFGPPPHHPRLASRIGDYALIMKDNWTIIDWLPGEKRYRQLGVHGGTSADEMLVPLIAARV